MLNIKDLAFLFALLASLHLYGQPGGLVITTGDDDDPFSIYTDSDTTVANLIVTVLDSMLWNGNFRVLGAIIEGADSNFYWNPTDSSLRIGNFHFDNNQMNLNGNQYLRFDPETGKLNLVDRSFLYGNFYDPSTIDTTSISPDQVSGMVAWYDVNDLSTVFEDEAGTIPTQLLVQRVNDKSGNGHHITSSVLGALAVDEKINNRRKLRFGTTTSFSTTNSVLSGSQDRTVFVVGEFGGATQVMLRLGTTGTAGGYQDLEGTNEAHFRVLQDANGTVTFGNHDTKSTELMIYRLAGTTLNDLTAKFNYKNLSSAVENNAAINTQNGLTVGLNGFNGSVSEIIIYDRNLSDSEVIQVSNYIYNKYHKINENTSISKLSQVENAVMAGPNAVQFFDQGQKMLILGREGAVTAWDISNPYSVTLLGSIDTLFGGVSMIESRGLYVVNDTMAIVSDSLSVNVFDISNPANILAGQRISGNPAYEELRHWLLDGDHLIAVNTNGYISDFSIVNNSNISYVGSHQIGSENLQKINAYGDYLFASVNGATTLLYSINYKSNGVILAPGLWTTSFNLGRSSISPIFGNDFEISNQGFAYIVENTSDSVFVIDVRQGDNISVVSGTASKFQTPIATGIFNNKFAVGDGEVVTTYDISNPSSLAQVAFIQDVNSFPTRSASVVDIIINDQVIIAISRIDDAFAIYSNPIVLLNPLNTTVPIANFEETATDYVFNNGFNQIFSIPKASSMTEAAGVAFVATGVQARQAIADNNIREVVFQCDSIVLDTNIYINRAINVTLPACASLTAKQGMVVQNYYDVGDSNERVGCGVFYVDSLGDRSAFNIHGDVHILNTNEVIPGSTGRARMSSIFARGADNLQINHPGFAWGGWNGLSIIDANNISITSFAAKEPNTGQSGGADNSNAAVYPENVTNLSIGNIVVLGRADRTGGYEEIIDPNAGMTDVKIEKIYAEDVELGLGINNSHRVVIGGYTCWNCGNGIDFFNYARDGQSGILWSSLNSAMKSQDRIEIQDAHFVYDSRMIYGSATPIISLQSSNIDIKAEIIVDSSFTGNISQFLQFEGRHDQANSDAPFSQSVIDLTVETITPATSPTAIIFDQFDYVIARMAYFGPVSEGQTLIDWDPDGLNESCISVNGLYLKNTANTTATAFDTTGLTLVDFTGTTKVLGFESQNDSLILEIDWLTSSVDTLSGGDINTISSVNNALFNIAGFGTGSTPNHSNTDSAWVFQASNTEYLRNDQIALNVADYQTDLTIISAVRFDAASPNQATLFQFSDGTNDDLLQAQWNNSNADSLQYTFKSTTSDAVRPDALMVNTWYILTIVYDASAGTADMYVNETLLEDDVEFNEQATGFSQFSIGYKNSDGLRPADMSLKYFKIYKGVYDPVSEIQALNAIYSIY